MLENSWQRVVAYTGFAVTLLGACGGSSEGQRPAHVPALSAEDRALFEDGIDFVADPEVLEGRWRDDWSRELDQRVRRSDIVARVTINTVRTDTDLDRRVTLRLLPEADHTYVGTFPEDLALLSREGEPGFGTVEGNERRILNHPFILFLKWDQPDADQNVVPRWHLSPAEEPVVQRTEYLLERRRGHDRDRGERRVHIHREQQ